MHLVHIAWMGLKLSEWNKQQLQNCYLNPSHLKHICPQTWHAQPEQPIFLSSYYTTNSTSLTHTIALKYTLYSLSLCCYICYPSISANKLTHYTTECYYILLPAGYVYSCIGQGISVENAAYVQKSFRLLVVTYTKNNCIMHIFSSNKQFW